MTFVLSCSSLPLILPLFHILRSLSSSIIMTFLPPNVPLSVRVRLQSMEARVTRGHFHSFLFPLASSFSLSISLFLPFDDVMEYDMSVSFLSLSLHPDSALKLNTLAKRDKFLSLFSSHPKRRGGRSGWRRWWRWRRICSVSSSSLFQARIDSLFTCVLFSCHFDHFYSLSISRKNADYFSLMFTSSRFFFQSICFPSQCLCYLLASSSSLDSHLEFRLFPSLFTLISWSTPFSVISFLYFAHPASFIPCLVCHHLRRRRCRLERHKWLRCDDENEREEKQWFSWWKKESVTNRRRQYNKLPSIALLQSHHLFHLIMAFIYLPNKVMSRRKSRHDSCQGDSIASSLEYEVWRDSFRFLLLFLYFSCLRNESLDEDFQATTATSSSLNL